MGITKTFFCKYQLFEFDTNFSLNISLFTAMAVGPTEG